MLPVRKELTHTGQPSFTVAPLWGQRSLRDWSWSQQKECWYELFHPNPLSSSFPDHKASKGRRGESKGRTTKAEILTPPLPSANTISSSPMTSPTPVAQIWGVSVKISPTPVPQIWGVSVTSQTPFLPASTNQIILRQVPAAQVAWGLLPLHLGLHPWVLQAHPLLQDLSSRMCSAQAFLHLPVLRVVPRLSDPSSLSFPSHPSPISACCRGWEQHPWKWKVGRVLIDGLLQPLASCQKLLEGEEKRNHQEISGDCVPFLNPSLLIQIWGHQLLHQVWLGQRCCRMLWHSTAQEQLSCTLQGGNGIFQI